jgi:hypothetical protein
LRRYEANIRVALEHAGNLHTFEDVQILVQHDRLQVWASPSGGSILLTELIDLPSGVALHYFLAAGRLTEIVALRPKVLRWARAANATREIITGRKGWERILRRLDTGWSEPQIQMVRTI